MAIAVSQAYKDVHARKSGKIARVVIQYKRRYFDAGAGAFAYEPNWHVLQQRDFVDPGEIVDQLDVAEPNVFKATTVTLRLNNTRNQWVRSVNDPSAFAADALAPNGYYDDQTVFQILYGYKLPDGTWEDCPQFTGYAFDYTPLAKQGYMEVAVSSSLLAESCAATKINTAVTGEAMALSVVDEPLNPSPGDGTTAVLKTTATGVISVANVKANGVALTLTTDYSISIPTDGTAAKITLVSPSAQAGKALTWSGVTGNLLTTSSAVAVVKTIYADASALTQGADYTVSIPTNAVGPAQITLIDPELWIGKAFTWDGTKGALNKTLEQAVAMYCDAAGIGSGMRNIQTVIFPGGLSGKKIIDSQTDWQAATSLTNISTIDIPGSITRNGQLIDDFSDNNYTSNPIWTATAKNSASADASSGSLNIVAANTSGSMSMETAYTQATGSWRFGLNMASFAGAGSVNGRDGATVMFQQTVARTYSGISPQRTGYGLRWNLNFNSGGSNQLQLVRFDGNYNGTVLANLGTFSTGSNTYLVTRDGSGVMSVYINGVFVGTATDNTYTTCAYIGYDVVDSSGHNVSSFLDDLYYFATVLGTATDIGVAEYVFNLLSTPTALGTLDHFENLNGGSVVLKTACAPDSAGSPGSFDALQTLGAGNQMTSTARQWLKIRVEITPAAGGVVSPEVQKLVANFTLSSVTLSQVAPTSGTAWDKIQVYARMCNYETGWDSTGILFFRSRTVSGSPVIDLDPWTNIIDVDDTHPGWDRVFNIGHASQPPYEYYYSGADAGEAEPTSERRFGPIQRDLDFSGELVANDAAIGFAAAQVAYLDNFRPRWRCRVPSKLIPWLEMSDPVALTMVPDRKLIENIAGDPLQQSGFAGAQGVALAIKKKMKIVGRTKTLKAATADLLLEEILS